MQYQIFVKRFQITYTNVNEEIYLVSHFILSRIDIQISKTSVTVYVIHMHRFDTIL